MGDTTSHASNLNTAHIHYQLLEFMSQRHGHAYLAVDRFPPGLFAQLIAIGHLRFRATKALKQSRGTEDTPHEAQNVLQNIHSFLPELWAESKPRSKADWVLIGRAYQAATIIYCISSLQSLSVLPSTPTLRDSCLMQGEIVQNLLEEGLLVPKLRWFLLWPLVILGTQATSANDTVRRVFVRDKLYEMSRFIGLSSPLVAKEVLERFWASGKTSWDDCFDKQYVFTSLIALNVGSQS
ncbi:hypothetical protein A1O3_10318 [Capronia epimyces CBS 606.96]|uniref:Transcription factor domain-containing protein n=1 Tax=Capronia epimyces CBS 606.96 TaxID=1182542 RepID=W9XII2_9EURO|nr:uncharacterized protein A1O3_10318 [Capronia epimyces CBS 606.96]EXJ77160.1 hypothetical protein A1O3_10318 [Capronia epimyces CBS 606.96]